MPRRPLPFDCRVVLACVQVPSAGVTLTELSAPKESGCHSDHLLGGPCGWRVSSCRSHPLGRSLSCFALPVPGAGDCESLHPDPGRGGHHREEGRAHQAAGSVCGRLHQGNASLHSACAPPTSSTTTMFLLSVPRMAAPMPSRDRVPQDRDKSPTELSLPLSSVPLSFLFLSTNNCIRNGIHSREATQLSGLPVSCPERLRTFPN